MASDIEIKKAIEKVFKIDKLKEKQRAITVAALKKKDCIAILPTGYGKSLPYQMLISLRRMLQIPGADRTNFGKICCVFTNNCVNARPNGQIELYSKRESSLQRYVLFCVH